MPISPPRGFYRIGPSANHYLVICVRLAIKQITQARFIYYLTAYEMAEMSLLRLHATSLSRCPLHDYQRREPLIRITLLRNDLL